MHSTQNAFLFRELQVIQKVIQDETWLEGERRGCYVSADDPVVRDRVCAIILRIGQQLRESVQKSLPPTPDDAESARTDAHEIAA